MPKIYSMSFLETRTGSYSVYKKSTINIAVVTYGPKGV